MKGALTANDEMLLEERETAWRELHEDIRTEVKAALVDAISCPVPVARHTAAQVIARIGGIEVPAGVWPLLISGLLQLWGADDAGMKHTALEALGYLCEELSPGDVAPDTTNEILTAIIAGLGAGMPVEIRAVAAIALNNALVFAKHNMDVEAERNAIMDAIATTTQCEEDAVRAAAFECITQVAFLYYDILPQYMQGLCLVTFDAVRKLADEKVALQAIEFWCTVAETEHDRLERIEEAKVRPRAPAPAYARAPTPGRRRRRHGRACARAIAADAPCCRCCAVFGVDDGPTRPRRWGGAAVLAFVFVVARDVPLVLRALAPRRWTGWTRAPSSSTACATRCSRTSWGC
jgi:importin subunit beta-1